MHAAPLIPGRQKNELQELYNGKSLVEDGQFALEVLEHINDKINEYKEADGHLYAIYGTPAENLCGLQVIRSSGQSSSGYGFRRRDRHPFPVPDVRSRRSKQGKVCI